MQCRFTDYKVQYIKRSDTHNQTAHLITLQLARSFTAPLVACANCMTCYPNYQCGLVRFSNKYALDVSRLWEDRCVWVCICVFSLALSLFRSVCSGFFFSRASPYWLHYFSPSFLIPPSTFCSSTIACLLSFIPYSFSFLPNSYSVAFLPSRLAFLSTATGATQPAAPLGQTYRRSIFSTHFVYFVLKISIFLYKIWVFLFYLKVWICTK